MEKGAWIFLIIMGLVLISVITGFFVLSIRSINTRNYCESLGYDYYEIIGKESFNCCKEEIPRIIKGAFEEGIKKCVVGGTYPAKK